MVETLVPGLFKIKMIIEHISGQTAWNVKKFVSVVCQSRGLQKYVEIKVRSTCFYLVWSFFEKQKEV